MKATDSLTTLYSHNLWANAKLLACCATLSDTQLDASIIGTFGSIRNTLIHLVGSERSYLSRLATRKPLHRPEGQPPPTLADLQALSRQSGQGLIDVAPTIQPNDAVTIDWDGQPVEVPLVILLTQAINHATEHRAQVMATLTQLGVEPPNLDAWTYFEALSGL